MLELVSQSFNLPPIAKQHSILVESTLRKKENILALCTGFGYLVEIWSTASEVHQQCMIFERDAIQDRFRISGRPESSIEKQEMTAAYVKRYFYFFFVLSESSSSKIAISELYNFISLVYIISFLKKESCSNISISIFVLHLFSAGLNNILIF